MRPPHATFLRSPLCRHDGIPASYDWKGSRYEWPVRPEPGRRAALDVERLDTPQPEGLVPPEWTWAEFLAAWTRAEVMAKLSDTPVAVWVRSNPLEKAELGRWSEDAIPACARRRVFTGVESATGIVFSCGWAEEVAEASHVSCDWLGHGGSPDDQP